MSYPHLTRQIEILHISDLHFGEQHRFNPARTPSGDVSQRTGMPSLSDKILADLRVLRPSQFCSVLHEASHLVTNASRAEGREHPAAGRCPRIVCITGDLTSSASDDEFAEAVEFTRAVDSITAPSSGAAPCSVHVVPGNHDVLFDEEDLSRRWRPFTGFFNQVFGEDVDSSNPWAFARVHDMIDDWGAVILCLNSCVYVSRGSSDENRGQLDEKQLEAVEEQLEMIPLHRRRSAIRLALIHHHPVLLPTLAEAKKGYDAVIRSGELLSMLRKYGFHLLLHGHKHYPHTFVEDITNAFDATSDQPMLIVAGGSAGSTILPSTPRAMNTYNRILVKWHPGAGQARVKVVTRGLRTYDGVGRPLLATRWEWETIREDDRFLTSSCCMPEPDMAALGITESDPRDPFGCEEIRRKEYARTRGNLPVVEVRPSLDPEQAYEARFWIVRHRSGRPEDLPVEVTWSAGPMFPEVTVNRDDDPWFCASFDYWDSMLVQARLRFGDGESACAHVYARIPGKPGPVRTGGC